MASLKEFVTSKTCEDVSQSWGLAGDFYQDIGMYDQAETCAKMALQALERSKNQAVPFLALSLPSTLFVFIMLLNII